jgi:hypothetical protein
VPLAIRYAFEQIRNGVSAELAVTSGYAMAFRIGTALMILAGVLIAALFERVSPELRDPTAEIVGAAR